MPDDLAIAIGVIEQQITGLSSLKEHLSDDFSCACDIIEKLEGRLILCGMGKSGHIARKIAATFASTGTPAMFVHPGEASHGDLGMIAPGDVVILLSNSGETQELSAVIEYTQRFSIPLIAIVRREKSTLVDAANIAFILPEIDESTPLNAPTTSTTMMLVWGDALAVAVMQRKGFTKEHFKTLHPGGKLGNGLTKVEKLMHGTEELPLVGPEVKMSDAIIEISAKRFGCVAVVDEKNILLGVITDGDLRRHMGDDLLQQTAKEIMTTDPKVVAPDVFAAEAVAIMNNTAITSLFVVEDKKPVGILHIHDLLRAGLG